MFVWIRVGTFVSACTINWFRYFLEGKLKNLPLLFIFLLIRFYILQNDKSPKGKKSKLGGRVSTIDRAREESMALTKVCFAHKINS